MQIHSGGGHVGAAAGAAACITAILTVPKIAVRLLPGSQPGIVTQAQGAAPMPGGSQAVLYEACVSLLRMQFRTSENKRVLRCCMLLHCGFGTSNCPKGLNLNPNLSWALMCLFLASICLFCASMRLHCVSLCPFCASVCLDISVPGLDMSVGCLDVSPPGI